MKKQSDNKMALTAAKQFRQAVTENKPLQVVGTVNAYTALMASKLGHKAIYLSGAACANASYGLPDLGMTGMQEVLEDARRITSTVSTPLLVDIDTGWGSALNIARTVREFSRAGVAAVHIEDQVTQKRCGHRPNKEIVSQSEMCDRIKAAVDARDDSDFFIMARTDAYSREGLNAAIERANAYREAGADGIFAEAMASLDEYAAFKNALPIPILANMTEFGVSPLYTREELAASGVDIILYPLTALRAMNRAAELAYKHLLDVGDQRALLESMQTRAELYDYLDYHRFEEKVDRLFQNTHCNEQESKE